ncbi:GNAT family N-acetyltransferase [Salinisphaera hydrothermalis]|uniref:Acetyltransferase n=1 Tax=Salinisphaera hydrothermalis (strain C41B8) TaxID=1304275 RepID=A0A084IN06_SALHC|nr:GNAT family N-acetyltransferase [Salinisphaera hydrothermalis]KEZ78090.1 acetyltransferase [Salinisphaera hydrothermalis C41B8]
MSAPRPADDIRIRRAALTDLDALMALEHRCFAQDAQSRRSMRHLIQRAHGELRIAEAGGRLLGYLMLLYRRGTRVARIYSIAVDAQARGRGLARRLIDDAEQSAKAAGCTRLSAEARLSNTGSRALFAACGFDETGRLIDYYEDTDGGYEAGVRLGKRLLFDEGSGSP